VDLVGHIQACPPSPIESRLHEMQLELTLIYQSNFF
jgi:hypothetical protein